MDNCVYVVTTSWSTYLLVIIAKLVVYNSITYTIRISEPHSVVQRQQLTIIIIIIMSSSYDQLAAARCVVS